MNTTNRLIWIDWLSNVRDDFGPRGKFVAGPVAQGTTVVYITNRGGVLETHDWKDVLLQRGQGEQPTHYRGEEPNLRAKWEGINDTLLDLYRRSARELAEGYDRRDTSEAIEVAEREEAAAWLAYRRTI